MPPRPRFTAAERKALWERDSVSGKAKCRICKCALEFPDIHIDHVIPVSDGGEHHLNNWQILCMTCNTSKQSKSMKQAAAAVLSPEELFEIRVHEEVMRRLAAMSLGKKEGSGKVQTKPSGETTKDVPKPTRKSKAKLSSSESDEDNRCEYIISTTNKRCKKYRSKNDIHYCSIHSKATSAGDDTD